MNVIKVIKCYQMSSKAKQISRTLYSVHNQQDAIATLLDYDGLQTLNG